MRKLQQKHQKTHEKSGHELCVVATGGGAFKYYDHIKESLGVEVLREDEMECLIIGGSLSFVSTVAVHTVQHHRSDVAHSTRRDATNIPAPIR